MPWRYGCVPMSSPSPTSRPGPADSSPARLAEDRLGRCLVTGGAGFLAGHVTRALLARGIAVRGLDLREPDIDHPAYEFQRGDLRAYEEVRKACEGIDTVFHTAAVVDFVGIASPARRRRSVELNVGGTQNVLRAARESGVSRLVYTSSNNVVLGTPVVDADGSTPYPKRYVDLYSETKATAERAVLAANGQGGLLTCALRPGGIYGPGDPFYLPTMIEKCARGLLVADIGDGTALADNTFVENLVHGELLAARSLVPGAACAGRAYYVTDGEPTSALEFFRPLIEAMGFRHPTRRLPYRLMFAVGLAWEWLARWHLAPEPLVTRVQVMKVAVSHAGSLAESRRDLGYEPVVDWRQARDGCIPWCREVLARLRAGRSTPRRSLPWSGGPAGKDAA